MLEALLTIVCLNPFLSPAQVRTIRAEVAATPDALIMPFAGTPDEAACSVTFVRSDTTAVSGGLALFDDSKVLTRETVRVLLRGE